MEQKRKNNSQKAALIATIVILVGALLVAGCLLLTVKTRVAGMWSGGPVYLETYGSSCNRVIIFEKNGDYSSVMTDSSGNIRKIGSGVWEVSFFQIQANVFGDVGTTIYDYNPITNKITSGSWTYKQISLGY